MRGYTRNLPALQNGADFPTCYLQPRQIQLISKLFEGTTSVLSGNWRLFASVVSEKASCLTALGQTRSITKVALPFLLFLRSDVSEKVWPQQLLLNKKGSTPNCR